MSIRLHLAAVRDLMKRYANVFSFAWQHRAEMDMPPRLAHEAQFLPAALALQETPVSPAPRLMIWLLIIFTCIAMAWAYLGHIDVVATAQGKIVPNGRTKTIQALETATVRAIHVNDGQHVNAGDLLIELDATQAHADKQRIEADLQMARLQAARSLALLTAVDGGKNPKLPYSAGIDENRFRESELLLAAQYREYLMKLRRIEAEIGKRQAEWRSTLKLVQKLELTLPIAEQRAKDFKRLADRHFVSNHQYLEQEQIRIEQSGDLANQRSRLQEIEAALRETDAQHQEITAETRRISLDSLTESRQKVADWEQELLKADVRGDLMRLTSPVAGVVQQLAVHTLGGVVTPAQAVMLIVPDDHALEIEAFIDNKDIGFVKSGQEAEVKIETFQYTKYGTIRAQVLSVSHDAINDEKRGLIYSARIKMAKSTLNVDGSGINLGPGMAASVEIKTGKRRVIEYFLNPLLQYRHESLRER